MTDWEEKELELFHKWYLDYNHEGNISDIALSFMEDAWLARSKLNKSKSYKTYLSLINKLLMDIKLNCNGIINEPVVHKMLCECVKNILKDLDETKIL